jgi:hypothetical protein
MRVIAAAILFQAVTATATLAGGLTDCGLSEKNCQSMKGKRLWIVVPKTNAIGVELAPAQGDYAHTTKLRSGSFIVTGILPNPTHGTDFAVKMSDGKTGYIWATFAWMQLSETDPVDDARKQAEATQARHDECVRRGQPKIGMTVPELTETCWGRPARVVKKTTANGVEENYIYGIGHIVKFTEGKVSEIVEAR